MERFTIDIMDNGDVYVNGTKHVCDNKMDVHDSEVDQHKRAILALVNEMGYEPGPLLEEMVDRLDEMIN